MSDLVQLVQLVKRREPDDREPDMGTLLVSTSEASASVEPSLPDDLAIYAGSLYAWAVLWLVCIVGTTQAVKVVFGPLIRRRAVYSWLKRSSPIIISMITAPIFGPPIALAFGYVFTGSQCLYLFGPGAGIAAMGIYSLAVPDKVKRAINFKSPHLDTLLEDGAEE